MRIAWQLESDREQFGAVEVEFKYQPEEIPIGYDESEFILYRADSPDGPWTPVEVQSRDTNRRRLRGTTEALGYFAIADPTPPVCSLWQIE